MNRIRLLAMVGAIALGIAAGIWLGPTGKKDPAADNPYAHIGGDFTLHASTGPVALGDLRGKVVPIYFGFTHCPDICPTTLQNLGAAIRQLPADRQAEINALFITLDPERDTVDRTDAYGRHFSDRITGLSGSAAEIADVAKRFLVVYEKVALPDSSLDYTIDHSSRLYVVGRDGQVRALLNHDATQEEIAARLGELLES